MGSSFHYTIDLNEDENYQPFFSPLGSSLQHHQVPSNLSSSSSSLTSPSLSYLPFLINSHQDQVHVGYNNNTFHGFLDLHLSQSLETEKFLSNGGSPSSDQMVPKNNHHDHDQTDLHQYPRKGETETNSLKWSSSKVRLMKRKTMITSAQNNKQHVNNDQSLKKFEGDHHDHLKKVPTNQYNIIVNESGYNGSNNCMVRICSDCNTTKTPLWRSGPRGPKSLCNACGIRQRKARRAAMAAAAATTNSEYLSPPLLKKKMQSKKKRSNEVCNHPSSSLPPKVKKCKNMTTSVEETQGTSTILSSSTSSNKFYFDDLAMILSKSSAYHQQVFPQDEKEAAILLMALSYGMVHG